MAMTCVVENGGISGIEGILIGVLFVLVIGTIWTRQQAIKQLKRVEKQNSHLVNQMAELLKLEVIHPEIDRHSNGS